MKTEDISWKIDGINIKGEVNFPSAPTGPFPGLILCHGIPAKVKDPGDQGYQVLAERFCQQGFAVLTFNFRGAGLSEGNFDILGWTRDLAGALDYIAIARNLTQAEFFSWVSAAARPFPFT